MLPSDFHAVLSACEFHDISLAAIADDVREELREHAIERARASRQARIGAALPQLRAAVEAKLRALEPKRMTLPTLPQSADDVFVFCRLSGGQLGAPFDPDTRTHVDVHVGFLGAAEWSALAAATPHRIRDVTFTATGPFTDLRALWARCRNWSGVEASANSAHSPGDLASVLDRLCASVPSELSATWWRNADSHLAQQIRAACQRVASKGDPEHGRRWSPPWEAASEQAAE